MSTQSAAASSWTPPAPAIYVPRRMACVGVWEEAGAALKAYAIHRDRDAAVPILPAEIAAAARRKAFGVLQEVERDAGFHGLGYCIAHVGEEAVWLLVDWWRAGGIVCQKLLSAPLSSPADFKTVQAPFLACVWELAVIGHERDAWVRNMMRAAPDAQGYLADRLAPGEY